MLQTYDPLLLVFAGTGIVLVVHLLKIRRTVLNKRRLISDVTSLGTQPRDPLDRAWTGEDYLALDGKLCEWARQIREIARRHATAPWLHEFDGAGPSSSQPLSVAIAIVDDTLSVLMSVVPAEERPAQSVLLSLRGAINELTKTLPKAGIAAGLTVPSRPLLPERLESVFLSHAAELTGLYVARRRLLHAWVSYDNAKWYDDQPVRVIGYGNGERSASSALIARTSTQQDGTPGSAG